MTKLIINDYIVYFGSKNNKQLQPFLEAMAEVDECLGVGIIKVEVLNNDKFREMHHMNFTMLVDWLLESHIHFILGHPHQGLDDFGWSIAHIYSQLDRLTLHIGNILCAR